MTSQQIPFNSSDPFKDPKFMENPEQRCACVLLLDTSGSMNGTPITQLNDALKLYRDEVLADTIASRRLEIAIVTFGGRVTTVSPFTNGAAFQPPTLSAEGDTPMGEAIEIAAEMLYQEKQKYKSNGITYYRPWIVMITDGQPTDGERWKTAAQKIKEGENNRSFAFFCIAVQGANMEILKQISVRPPMPLDGYKFREFFLWLSASQAAQSRSNPGETVPLQDPKTAGWTSI